VLLDWLTTNTPQARSARKDEGWIYIILQGIKESLPAANSESPQAVLEFVRDAVRAHAATVIEDCKNLD